LICDDDAAVATSAVGPAIARAGTARRSARKSAWIKGLDRIANLRESDWASAPWHIVSTTGAKLRNSPWDRVVAGLFTAGAGPGATHAWPACTQTCVDVEKYMALAVKELRDADGWLEARLVAAQRHVVKLLR
jgi:hypothetical protein